MTCAGPPIECSVHGKYWSNLFLDLRIQNGMSHLSTCSCLSNIVYAAPSETSLPLTGNLGSGLGNPEELDEFQICQCVPTNAGTEVHHIPISTLLRALRSRCHRSRMCSMLLLVTAMHVSRQSTKCSQLQCAMRS
jgi:hypothetical protein